MKYTKEHIKGLLETNDRMLYRSLMMLYYQQTQSERDRKATTNRNGVGFNSCDAEIMTSFAEFLKRVGFLTQKQKNIARKKIMKYAQQLTDLANEEAEAREATA